MSWIQGIGIYWADGGWLLWPIAAVSFAIWAYWLRLREGLQEAVQAARFSEERLDECLTGRRAPAAVWSDLRSSTRSVPGYIVAVGEEAADGLTARRRFQEWTDRHRAWIQRDVGILKALTAAAPLLGLLGTVTGMVDTFMAVAQGGGEGASLVAAGVHTALITTQFGLLVALPGVFGLVQLGRLRTRLDSTFSALGMMLYVAFEEQESC